MHDMILAQPRAIEETVASALDTAAGIPLPPKGQPLLFVGQGTSYHAALGATAAARALLGPHALVRAIASFDLLLDPELVRAAGGAVVFSSSGETALTIQAQRALRGARVRQTLITGTARSPSGRLADHVVLTERADEKAWTHTVSFTTALTAAYALLATWRGGPARRRGLYALSRAAADAVRRESEWRSLAKSLVDRRTLLFLGSGPAEVTIRESALKLREGAGRFVAWCGVEEFLHGTLPSVDDRTAVVALAEGPLEVARSRQALEAARLAGARVALLGRFRVAAGPNEHRLPPVAVEYSPAVHVIPLQLVTYWTAVAEGRNPDVMGYDDPRIWTARRSYGI
jgi:glutamine---fructose-6-phosphate transaminase (isomerizing)